MSSDGSINGGYKIIPCFTLHYDDYNGNTYYNIYTISDDEFDDDLGRKIFGDTMKVLEEISELPNPDILRRFNSYL